MSFVRINVYFLVLIIFTSLLVSCGGGSDAESTVGNFTISGIAADDPLSGASVVLQDINGTTLTTGTTKADGRFSLLVEDSDIQDGYQLVVTNGQIQDTPFLDELRAIYSVSDDPTAANVTLVTTLVSKLVDMQSEGTLLERRNTIIDTLSDIGLFSADKWNRSELSTIALELLRESTSRQSLAVVVSGLAADLQDNDLSPEYMPYFPEAHGGIIEFSLGETDNHVSGFPGSSLSKPIQLIAVENDSPGYSYSVVEGAGLSVDGQGNLFYQIPESETGGNNIPFVVEARNSATGKGRLLRGELYVIPADVFEVGIVGSKGGVLRDEVNNIEIVVPPGAVAADVNISIVRGRDAQGNATFEMRSSGETGNIKLYLPDPELLEQIIPADSTMTTRGSIQKVIAQSHDVAAYPAKIWLENRSWFHNSGVRVNREITMNIVDYIYGSSVYLNPSRATVKFAYKLTSTESLESQDIQGRIPVIFIHGYRKGGKLGGGESYWGDFPDRVAELESDAYLPFEFRWRTNARFQDVAEDLRQAINLIAQKTGKKVHIVAHSFGGILARVYLQGMAETRTEKYQRPVTSLTTIGTPHSGIADKDDKKMHGYTFMDGQDGNLPFDLAGQISVFQMGESLSKLNIVNEIRDNIKLMETEGYIAASIANVIDHPFPKNLPIQVLIGFTTSFQDIAVSTTPTNTSESTPPFIQKEYVLENGDGLITYSGQRFFPKLTNTGQITPLLAGKENENLDVTEHILGTDEDMQAGMVASLQPQSGYRHTAKSGLITRGELEAHLECNSIIATEIQNADKERGCDFHDSFKRVRLWLKSKPADEFSNYYENPDDKTTAEIKISASQIDTSQGAANIQMPITVVTQNGEPLKELVEGNFTLEETIGDAAKIVSINSVSTAENSGKAIAIVIDRSGSMGPSYNNDILAAKAAAKIFVDNMSPGDQAAIIDFAGDVVIRQSFTYDKKILLDAIESVDVGDWNGTFIFDAMYQAAELTSGIIGQKVVILLTDGGDTGSFNTSEAAIDKASSLGVPVYTIGLGVAPGGDEERALIAIANGTNAGAAGSGYYSAPTSAELEKLYSTILGVVNNSYTVRWHSSGSAEDVVNVKITVEYTSANGKLTDSFVLSYTVP